MDPDNTDYLAEAAQNGLRPLSPFMSTELPRDMLYDDIIGPDPQGSIDEQPREPNDGFVRLDGDGIPIVDSDLLDDFQSAVDDFGTMLEDI